MVNTPFLTLLDPRAKIKGSRDPLGLQPLWTALGRQVVRNLTTVTTSARGFSVLLLGLYFAERAIAEKQVPADRLVELFLKFEQLAAYSRIASQQSDGDYTEDEIRGIQRVKKNLSVEHGRVSISANAASQILSNQKTYGLWGLYMVAARNSKFIEPDSPRLTLEARTFIATEYDDQKRLTAQESGLIIDFLCKDKRFEPTGKDKKLARKLAGLLGETLTSAEREFYKQHLIECGTDDYQSTLWRAMRHVTRSELPFSMSDLRVLREYAQTHGHGELAKRLTQIQIAEFIFGPVSYMFSFLLTHDGQTIEYAAKEIKKVWGAKLRQIDSEAFTQVLNSLGERMDHETRTRFSNLAVALAGGDYSQAVELLMKQNAVVMQARGGNAWVTLKSRRISVVFRENTGGLPVREDLPDLWTNTYFLNALKRIGYQIDGGCAMTREPISAVLSDSLVNAIAKRRVKAAAFLTFQFDPGFFEDEILPLLFDQSFSHVPQLRRVQLEEALRSLKHLAVYYDRNGLTAEAQPARLDYRRIGLHRQKGCFHPKNIFLLLDNQDGDEYEEILLFATLSANLTRSGWWENVEVAYITEVRAGEKCTFRSELLDLISRLKQEDTTFGEHPALESIRAFMRNSVEESGVSKKQGRLLPYLYLGQKNVPEFLSHFIEPDTYNLDIISPYFDDSTNGQTLSKLIEWVRPKATRIFLPKASDGAANCQKDFFNQIAELPQVRWGLLSEGVTQMQSDVQSNMTQRFVHAKVYRFWNQSREILFLGSVNLTAAAHSPITAGNFETGILVETKVSGQQNWWLQPLADDIPTEFRDVSVEEADINEPPCVVTFCFDWETETLTYFWEAAKAPHRVEVFAQNVPKFTITPVRLNKWVTLPIEAAQSLKELLTSTSLLEVCVDDGVPFRVLVREEGMARKPALFLFLTSEEILHYWSLLSPEQREQFIAYKALMDIDGLVRQRQTSTISGTENSMFDRFAGIFHAFGRLEEYVREALEAGRETEADYRLLGEKHDSLPSLLDKVISNEEADRVHRYVTLLCAKQLLNSIEKDYSDFKARHQQAFKRMREQLLSLDSIEEGFTFETPEIRSEFFDWFKGMFLKPVKLPKAEDVT